MRRTCAGVAAWRRASGCEAGSTTTPPVVFVTGSSSERAGRAIMTPPSRTATFGSVVPPAASTTSAIGVPTGTRSVTGLFTAPATVRYLWVTGRPRPALTSVSTLTTSAPTSRGSPPGGITRPVTSWTSTNSSPAG